MIRLWGQEHRAEEAKAKGRTTDDHRSDARIFDQAGALDKFEAFASLNGAAHYGLPANQDTITLERVDWTAPEEVTVPGPEERAIIYRGGETIEWRVVPGKEE